MPRISQAAFTSSRTGMRAARISTPTPAEPAISHNVVARPPRVGSPFRRAAHGRQDGVRRGWRDEGHQLAFVGDVERVHAEDLTGRLHFFADRDAGRANLDPDARRTGDLA